MQLNNKILYSNISFIRPAVGKYLTAEAKLLKDGKMVCFYEINVYDDNDTLIVSIEKLYEIIEAVLNENNGMAQLSVIVESIRKAYTDFDVRNYGYQKARDFFSASFKDKLKLTEEKKNSYFLSFKDKKEEKEEKTKKDIKKESKPKRSLNKKSNPKKNDASKKVKEKKQDKSPKPVKMEVEDDLKL